MTTMLDCQNWPVKATSKPAKAGTQRSSRSRPHTSQASNAVKIGANRLSSKLTSCPARGVTPMTKENNAIRYG